MYEKVIVVKNKYVSRCVLGQSLQQHAELLQEVLRMFLVSSEKYMPTALQLLFQAPQSQEHKSPVVKYYRKDIFQISNSNQRLHS